MAKRYDSNQSGGIENLIGIRKTGFISDIEISWLPGQ